MSTVMLSLILKVTLVTLLGMALTALFRRTPAAFRHTILLSAIISVLVLPVLIAVAPRWNVMVLEPSGSEISSASTVTVGPRTQSVGSQADNSADFTSPGADETLNQSQPLVGAEIAGRFLTQHSALLFLWLVGSLGVLGWLALGHLRLHSLAKNSWPLDGADWGRSLREESIRANVGKDVRLLCHPDVSTPLTWGSSNCVIMLPEDALEWSEDHRRIVLRHELSHVARNDALAQLAAGIACAIYWFHPLVWITERKLRAECERACDERVVASGTPAPIYAAHLLEVARSARSFGGPGFLSVAMARPSQLEGRLLAVLDESGARNPVSRPTRWLMLTSMVAVVLVVSAFRPVHRVAESVELPPVETTAEPAVVSALGITRPADSTFQRIVDVRSGGTLTLDIKRTGGTVTISSWDRSQVMVRARLGGRDWRDTRVTIEPTNGGAIVRDNYIGRSENTSFSHSFDIQVPRSFSIRLNSAGGGISISGVNGTFEGTTGGGEITLYRASGEANLRTGGGDVVVANSSLRGKVTTGGGAVRIDGSGRDLEGSSGTGDVIYTNSRSSGSDRTSVDNDEIPRSGGTTTFMPEDFPDSVIHFGEGGIQRHRSGGDITIGEAPNGARVSTGGGAVRIGPSNGQVYATTGGGSIEIGPASGSVIASTGAGTITVTFRGSGLHAADLTSGLGRIELILPANVNAELVLESAYTNNLAHKTRIESDWPLTITETARWDGSVGTPRKYVRARQILGTGGGVIRVRTVNGNVTIRKAASD